MLDDFSFLQKLLGLFEKITDILVVLDFKYQMELFTSGILCLERLNQKYLISEIR